MLDLPHDVLFLIADYFEQSELLKLASFHRYFLYEYLKKQYHRPVVLTDNLHGELGRLLRSDLKRIRGPISRKLIRRIELQPESEETGRKSLLSSIFCGIPRRSTTKRKISWNPHSVLVDTLHSLNHLMALHITQLHPPFSSETYASAPVWMSILPQAWPTLAPRLEELHVAGWTMLIRDTFSLNPQLCTALSVLCIELYPGEGPSAWLRRGLADSVIKFMGGVRNKLVSVALLGSRIFDTPQSLEHLRQITFPRLRALRTNLSSDAFGALIYSSPLLTVLNGHLRTLSIRSRTGGGGMGNLAPTPLPLHAVLTKNPAMMATLERLDLDLGRMSCDYDGIWPRPLVSYQKQAFDEVCLIKGLRELRISCPVAWIAEPGTPTGVASTLNPTVTIGTESRIFEALKSLSINVMYLRSQLFEDLGAAAPQLEDMHLEFQELWYPMNLTNQEDFGLARYRCASQLTMHYQLHPAVRVFSKELQSLRHLQRIRLQDLRLSWRSHLSHDRTVKEEMMTALMQNIPSLALATSSVKFVEPLEVWEQDLWWVEPGTSNRVE